MKLSTYTRYQTVRDFLTDTEPEIFHLMDDPEKAITDDIETLKHLAEVSGVRPILVGSEVAFPLEFLHDFYPANP